MKSGSKTISITLIVLILFSATMIVAASNIRTIRRQVSNKEYERAERELGELIPGLSGRSLSQARMLLAGLQTESPEAERIYSEILRSCGRRDAFPARVELAKIYYSTGRYRDLLEVLREVPEDAGSTERMEARFFRGLALKETGDSDAAAREFEAVDRGDYLYWSYMALAEIDIQYGRIEQAVERYEMIAGSHSNPAAGFKLGECYEILGEQEKALNTYGNLARLFPESLEAPQAREKLQVLGSRRKESSGYTGSKVRRDREEEAPRHEPVSTPSQFYTLQFGAFSVRENADAFATELSNAITGLRVESTESRGRTWYRVRVGRYESRELAEADALRFMEQTGFSSKVLPLD
ncbi:MAG TPA: SPOR domain-containing protein [Candidatus Krumholzibacterium sp.]|nr:SPOR domain-containing protein [Candidatus Krumholzibacterium sp.]